MCVKGISGRVARLARRGRSSMKTDQNCHHFGSNFGDFWIPFRSRGSLLGQMATRRAPGRGKAGTRTVPDPKKRQRGSLAWSPGGPKNVPKCEKVRSGRGSRKTVPKRLRSGGPGTLEIKLIHSSVATNHSVTLSPTW